jgi:hypothetical protein
VISDDYAQKLGGEKEGSGFFLAEKRKQFGSGGEGGGTVLLRQGRKACRLRE